MSAPAQVSVLPVDPLKRPPGSLHLVAYHPRTGGTSALVSYARYASAHTRVCLTTTQEVQHVARARMAAPYIQLGVEGSARAWDKADERGRQDLITRWNHALPGPIGIYAARDRAQLHTYLSRDDFPVGSVVVVDTPPLDTGPDLAALKEFALRTHTRVLALTCVMDEGENLTEWSPLHTADSLTRMTPGGGPHQRLLRVLADRYGHLTGARRQALLRPVCSELVEEE